MLEQCFCISRVFFHMKTVYGLVIVCLKLTLYAHPVCSMFHVYALLPVF